MSTQRVSDEQLKAILSYCFKPSENMLDEETASLALDLRDCRAALKQAEARVEKLTEALEEYGEHERGCILAQWGGGEPTGDGGYKTMYAGRWYETKPVDRTPACTCGFAAALADATSKDGGA